MHAGIPILASKLPEIEQLISKYYVGIYIDNHEPQHIAHKISSFLNSNYYLEYKSNTIIAAIENNWETEKQKLVNLLNFIKIDSINNRI